MNLPELAMKRPVTTMMVFVCMVVIGLISSRLVPLELFPEVSAPFLNINIPYPGSTPEEVEREITRPAEEVLATVPGLKRLNSNSGQSGANIFMEFDWGADTDLKAIQVRERLDAVRDQFPADVERMFVQRFNMADAPILQLRLSSERDLSGAYELLDRKLKQVLERVEGVSQVELYGVNRREVRIELLADRVAAHRVDLQMLLGQLQTANFSVTAGRITDGPRRYLIRPLGEIRTADEVRDLVIRRDGLRLGDVAEVTLDDPELDHGRHLNRRYAVGLDVRKEAGANTVAVSDRIKVALEEVGEDPDMAGISIYFMGNAADGITSSLTDLLESGAWGGLFALIVLFFFLRRLSTTLVVTLAVPISILVTVGALYFLGFSLNILSMMGLMLAVGMLVDNAVVVTENIHRHQRMDPGNPMQATLRGVKEVALAVTAGTLTTAIVFLPMIVSQADEVTLFLKHVAVSINVSLVVSLLISLTVVPLLASRLKPPPETAKASSIDWLTERYATLLDRLLRKPKLAAAVVVGTLLSVAIPASLVNMDFFPDNEGEREIEIIYNIQGQYTVEEVEKVVDEMEEYLFANKERFEIKDVYSFYTGNYAESDLLLDPDSDTDIEVLEERIREGFPKLALARPAFDWSSGITGENLRVLLHGESSEKLVELSREVAEMFDRMEGFKDVRSQAEIDDQEIQVVVDRDRARIHGLSTQAVAQTVSTAMRGQNLRRIRTPEGEVDLRIEFQDRDQRSMDDLRNLPLQTADQEQVRLAALADFQSRKARRGINRENRVTSMGVILFLDGITQDEGYARIRQTMERMELPPGYGWGYGSRFDDEAQSQQIMLVNLLMALVLIYLVMASLFESLIHPAAIWTSIIFAIVGVFWFFLATGTTFQIMAWIGILVLIGVVVNNGIVLIDHINHLRSEGLERHEAIVQAGRDRMRPIIMTAATTVLGLVPLCLGTTQIGGDGPPYFPMARAIVGGLTFSTLVTLVILPAIYVFLDDVRRWGVRTAREARVQQGGIR
ncbi:MAG: efflux RND transporter permease subunit [Rhodothermales bacterium]|nr:efflux RND transporter permease subunit [Rhodothermales bacterium]MBO6780565.1 efflux RND transporter permease subunit [Rhodothermales bacterium]